MVMRGFKDSDDEGAENLVMLSYLKQPIHSFLPSFEGRFLFTLLLLFVPSRHRKKFKTCRSCRYYIPSRGWCEYYKAVIPVILDDSCLVWSSVKDGF